MAHLKTCPGCNDEFWGNLNKLVCSDACRKSCKRRGIDIRASNLGQKTIDSPVKTTEPSGKARTGGGSGILDYAGKRLIDVGAHYLKNLNIPSKETIPDTPLLVTNLASNNPLVGIINAMNKISLSPDHEKFLSDISTPLNILLWGKPGGGKSTYALMLANQFCASGRVLFVSGEERPNGKTFQNKWTRTIEPQNRTKIDIITRLPTSTEWRTFLYDVNGQLKYKFIIYDSIQILKMDPFYTKNTAVKIGGTDFTDQINHVYISYADKEGTTYSGPAAWGHEVDIQIKCELGKAIIMKDRFASDTHGLLGAVFVIYKTREESI